jgi:hypothetical protein
MESTYNNFVVAVLTKKVTLGVCLEQSGPRMDAQPFTQIDQNTRNGP